jgi:hypothetical protein
MSNISITIYFVLLIDVLTNKEKSLSYIKYTPKLRFDMNISSADDLYELWNLLWDHTLEVLKWSAQAVAESLPLYHA